MSQEIVLAIKEFLRKKMLTHPEVSQPHYPRGWLEEVRVVDFQSIDENNIIVLNEDFLKGMKGQILQIRERSLSVVFGLYGHNSIIWLDDHTSNDDFQLFAQNEGLFAFLPERLFILAEIIAKIRFNFLGEPRVISEAAQIPRGKNFVDQETDQKMQKLLKDINFIPPRILSQSSHSAKLSFFVWTYILGNVFEVRCNLSSDGAFNYELLLLASGAGDYFAPR